MDLHNNTRLEYLFRKYYEKSATQQETDELYKLIENSDDDELISILQQLWEEAGIQQPLFATKKSEEILSFIFSKGRAEENYVLQKRKNGFFTLINVAAAVVFIALSILLYNYLKPANAVFTGKNLKTALQHDAFPGGNHATLTLANGTTVKLDDSPNGTLANQGASKISKIANGQLVCKVISFPHSDEKNIENTITTPRGGQYQILLADGSKVWLNAASSLRFPVNFNGRFRQVEITGEAYFEVAKNAGKPFIVKTRNAEVQVLGTHFNIMDYDDEPASKTTLLEGSVKIKSINSANVLKPGEQAVLNKYGKINVVNNIDTESETDWKNGIFSFKEAGIEDVMRQVSRWYDVSISYEGTIPVKQLTGTISRNVKASELLSMLSYTGINFKIEGKKIIVIN